MDFYLDHDVAIRVVDDLRALGHSARTTRDLGEAGTGDFRQLLTAAQRGWVLVSHNRKNFRLLRRAWLAWSQAWAVQAFHAGILILPHGRPADSARRLDEFARGHGASLVSEEHECSTRGAWTQDDALA